MRPVTLGVADTAPTHTATFARIQSAAHAAGFDGRLLHLAVPAQPAQLALCDSVLLMGLAIGTKAAMTAHAEFRQALSSAGLPYQVLYGLDDNLVAERIAFMQSQSVSAPHAALPGSQSSTRRSPWVWACDKCSDPLCEHRLLTDLIQQRQSAD